MSYTEQELIEVINRLKKGGDPDDFPPPLLFMAQYYLYKEGRMDLVSKIGAVANKRLIDKGLVRCGFLGWFTRKQMGEFGIVFKSGEWHMDNASAFKRFCDQRFIDYNSAPKPPQQTSF